KEVEEWHRRNPEPVSSHRVHSAPPACTLVESHLLDRGPHLWRELTPWLAAAINCQSSEVGLARMITSSLDADPVQVSPSDRLNV
ncbi:mCG129420, isoform CRA_a, partial [Mus musculus]